jgi:hypothetical protein
MLLVLSVAWGISSKGKCIGMTGIILGIYTIFFSINTIFLGALSPTILLKALILRVRG